jgi:hypothetical protein
VQHLVSSACGELDGPAAPDGEFGVGVTGRVPPAEVPGYQRYRNGVRGLRARVARLLDAVSGPNP